MGKLKGGTGGVSLSGFRANQDLPSSFIRGGSGKISNGGEEVDKRLLKRNPSHGRKGMNY